jgi:2-C-methyl-D-erythritol 4-phosphate cytidylyltransferase
MEAAHPKQYLPLAGKTVIEHSLAALLNIPSLHKIIVALGANDEYWRDLGCAEDARIAQVEGGKERQDSVLNALEALCELHGADAEDWVLVHDAARPCVKTADVEGLVTAVISACQQDAHYGGGLLAASMDNTVKESQESQATGQAALPHVVATRQRELLWQALTPQLFPLGLLKQALHDAAARAVALTDESSALERLGYRPLLVAGSKTNIKITHASDLLLAEAILASR